MSRIGWLLIVSLVLLLGACAPAVKGSNSLNAINLDDGDASVSPGGTWYVSSNWTPRAFGLNLPDLRDLFDTYEGQSVRTNLPGFKAFQVGLPEGWDFQIYGATGIQKIKNVHDTGNRVSVEWNEQVITTFIMTVPANTAPGTYNGLVTITHGDELQILPVRIKVTGQEIDGSVS
jgi:hypothetical protein